MQFITIQVDGVASGDSFLGLKITEAPGPAAIQNAIAGVLQSDGFNAPTIQVTASETGLLSSVNNPYTAVITVAASDSADQNQVATQVGNDVGAAVGAAPTSVVVTGTSSSAPAPASSTLSTPAGSGITGAIGGVFSSLTSTLQPLANAIGSDVQLVLIGLLALLALAVIVLAPELKRNLELA